MEKVNISAFALLLGSLLPWAPVSADQAESRHMLDFTTAGTTTFGREGMGFLFRVGYGYSKTIPGKADGPIEAMGPTQEIWVSVDGALEYNDGKIPYVDIRVTPLETRKASIAPNGDLIIREKRVLPIGIGRDIRRLDRKITAKVALVGIKYGLQRMQSDELAIFAQVAANAVGVKMAQTGFSRFTGAHVGEIEAGVGVAIPFDDLATIRVELGGSADLNLGNDSGEGFALQSDLMATLSIRADISRFIQVFVMGRYAAQCGSADGCRHGPELLFGAKFIL